MPTAFDCRCYRQPVARSAKSTLRPPLYNPAITATDVPRIDMKELVKGANAALAASGKVRVCLNWRTAPGELDFTCFALDARERVLADAWFVFYNQPASPGNAIRLDVRRAEFLINLDLLPGTVRKCFFFATLSGGDFRAVDDVACIVAPAAGDGVLFRLTEPVEGRSLLLVELYRYNDLWKVRAKGEGLKRDLAALADAFGVDVVDNAHHAATERAGTNVSAAADHPPFGSQATGSGRPQPDVLASPQLLPSASGLRTGQSAKRPTPSSITPPTARATRSSGIPRPVPDPATQPQPANAPSSHQPDTAGPAPAAASSPGFHERIKPYATPLAIIFSGLIGATATVATTLVVTQCAPHQSVQPVVIVQPPTTMLPAQQPASGPASPALNPPSASEKPAAKPRSSSPH
ncbi:MAG TPA: TerD family protein [Candidatus Competibacter sp.]|nr:TerD family protein [Candidatus Competibacter sp.]